MTTVKQTLIAARDLIAKPENWTQGAYARDSVGSKVGSMSKEATCWCSLGAVTHVSRTSDEYEPAITFLRTTLHKLDVSPSVIKYNDNHTHAEVLALFDKAIATCEN